MAKKNNVLFQIDIRVFMKEHFVAAKTRIEMNSKLKLLLAINHINFRIYANRCAAQTYQMRA